jgi:endonuclease YncB( thermonuclease family)
MTVRRSARAVAAVGAVVALVVAAPAAGQTVTGRASVTDADTLKIRDVDIRLQGIDAPEKRAGLCRGWETVALWAPKRQRVGRQDRPSHRPPRGP